MGAALAHGARQGASHLHRRGRHRVLGGVGDAHSPTQVDRGHLQAKALAHEGGEVDDLSRGLDKGSRAEDLRADVAVQAAKVQVGGALDGPHGA